MSKNRTLSIDISAIPKNRFEKHQNGKIYLNLSTYDFDTPDRYDNDFSVSLPLTAKQNAERKLALENNQNFTVERIFVGNGKVWGNKPVSDDEKMPWDEPTSPESDGNDLP